MDGVKLVSHVVYQEHIEHHGGTLHGNIFGGESVSISINNLFIQYIQLWRAKPGLVLLNSCLQPAVDTRVNTLKYSMIIVV